MWYMYTMEYYITIKRNEILTFAATWMDLKGIMLSERSQRKTSSVYHLHVEPKKYSKLVNVTKKKRLTDTENKLVVTSEEGEGAT